MTDKPAIVLVHGFWGGAAHWAKVIVELDRRGFTDVHAVENPSHPLPRTRSAQSRWCGRSTDPCSWSDIRTAER